jgi:maleylacetoacetate isomerase
MSITVYGYWRSSATWRVRIALGLKGIDYTVVPVHLVLNEQHSQEHLSRNPLGQVPAVEIDGRMLTQSVALLEYLEETYPSPALLPETALDRAYVRQAVEVINSGIQPLQNLDTLRRLQSEYGVERPSWKPWAGHFIQRGFEALETIVAPHAGTYAFNEQITFIDVCLVPQVYNAHRFEVDMAQFPTLERIAKSASLLPAFKAAHPDNQPDAQ